MQWLNFARSVFTYETYTIYKVFQSHRFHLMVPFFPSHSVSRKIYSTTSTRPLEVYISRMMAQLTWPTRSLYTLSSHSTVSACNFWHFFCDNNDNNNNNNEKYGSYRICRADHFALHRRDASFDSRSLRLVQKIDKKKGQASEQCMRSDWTTNIWLCREITSKEKVAPKRGGEQRTGRKLASNNVLFLSCTG